MSAPFKVRIFPAECAKCQKKFHQGDWAKYDEEGNLICLPCEDE